MRTIFVQTRNNCRMRG